MKIELIDLSEDNMKQCFELKVASDQMQYIASNKDSWKAAKENEKVARPFAIYCDGEMVGFTMFAFDEDYEDPDDRSKSFVILERRDSMGLFSFLKKETKKEAPKKEAPKTDRVDSNVPEKNTTKVLTESDVKMIHDCIQGGT